MKALKLVVFTLVLLAYGQAKTVAATKMDTLVLFTKPDCSNCNATKRQFSMNGVGYTEMNLNDDKNPPIMLKKLTEKGYKGKIYLPVMFLNGKLCHPAYENNKELKEIPIGDAVDSILLQKRQGVLHFAESAKKEVTPTPPVHDDDCEVKNKPIYIICYNYNNERDALETSAKLIKDGYIFSGVIFHENIYRVYCKLFLDSAMAETELTHIRQTFKEAYTLKMP